jgi:voltage-gated potassium channel Kch
MRRITLKDRLRYKFDNVMSRGTLALLGVVGLAISLLVLTGGLVMWLSGFRQEGEESRPTIENLWLAAMRALDTGNVGGDTGWGFRLVALAVTLGGIFVLGAFIAIMATGINARLVELRKGRSFVAETGHTVILGWSQRIFPIVSELVIANSNVKHSAIAILADRDKVRMEDDIHARIKHFGHTRLVCRTGNPSDLSDLSVINLHDCKAIIIIEPETGDPDFDVIKMLLAVTNSPGRREAPYHIVAALQEPESLEVAKMIGGSEVELLPADTVIARIAAQTCRQSGLSAVYTELLNFEGNEIYFQDEPRLYGKTYGEVLAAFRNAAVIGLRSADHSIALNPPMTRTLAPGDTIIAISEDDDTIKLTDLIAPSVDEAAVYSQPLKPRAPERSLILGWNRRAPILIRQLDTYASAGSEVTVVANHAAAETHGPLLNEGIKSTLTFKLADTTNRSVLEDLDVTSYDHVVTLSYSDSLDPQSADSRTLITLLHLRDIAQLQHRELAIVSEMQDVRNRDLATVTDADDFIVSEQLVSLMMSQVAENKDLGAVLQDLFDPNGSELYLKPAADYVATGRPVTFYTILEAARRRNETAVGYRLHAQAHAPTQGYGVVLNPDKALTLTLSDLDKVIVLADN